MEKIKDTEYCDIMENSYIDYAMSVITARAVPDVRDGLKPVQRRVLYSMYELGLKNKEPHRKSARIVGDAMGKYHPHGDSSIYEALVTMSQDFKKTAPLVDGHGNFGSIEGDGAAAMRYTEARLTEFAEDIYLTDLEKDVVDFVPNFDATEKEPSVLPSKLPCVLINGSEGIAVGMVTNIPPHNLCEVIDAEIAMLKNPQTDPMDYIEGPDFPTGGVIVNKTELKNIYKNGFGKIRIRGKVETEHEKNGKDKLVISEIPYTMIGGNIEKFIINVCELAEERKISEIANISNESSKLGTRIVIELKKGADPKRVEELLYKKTKLEDTFSMNMLVINDGKPEILSIEDLLKASIDFQFEINRHKYAYLLKKDEEIKHIKVGLIKACDMIDLIVEIIRGSETATQAKRCLTTGNIDNINLKTERSRKKASKLNFSDVQAQAILDLRLSRLIGLEVEQLKKDYDRLEKEIKKYEKLLSDDLEMKKSIIKELENIKKKYEIRRKTQITNVETNTAVEKPESPEERVFCMNRFGYVKLISQDVFKKNSEATKNGSRYVFNVKTDDRICLFTAQGNIYQINASKIPLQKIQGKGIPVDNISKFSSADEDIITAMPLQDIKIDKLLFITEQGMIKTVKGDEFIMTRYSGSATRLKEGDKVLDVIYSVPKTLTFETEGRRRLTINASNIPLQKKNAIGVIGIKLKGGDRVKKVSCDLSGEEIGKRGTVGKKKEV